MRKVMQTKTGLGGNCEGATIATLLGLNLEDIPDFWEGCDLEAEPSKERGLIYQSNLDRFLAPFGLMCVPVGWNHPDDDPNASEWVIGMSKSIGVPHLVNGISPRGHMHSVIYQRGEMIHDPHPEGGGVIPCQIQFLMPLVGYTWKPTAVPTPQYEHPVVEDGNY